MPFTAAGLPQGAVMMTIPYAVNPEPLPLSNHIDLE